MDQTSLNEYFEIMDGPDEAAAIRLFASEAVVVDDGHTYHGHPEILGWLVGAASEFTTVSERLSINRSDNAVAVVVRITGDFPGGKIDLLHRFLYDPEGRIEELTITA